MPSKNRYYRRSKISEAKFRHLLRLFAMDLTATDAAQLCGLSVRSVNTVYQRIRVRLAQQCAAQSPFSGELEADESYFGPKRIRGKRGRGAGGKTIVFGLPGRGDCVYTEIVPDASKATLQAIIRGKVDPNSIIHTDGWRGYDGLVDLGLEKHFRLNHGNNEFVKGSRHVNGIESFWSYAKHRLAQFHGVRRDKFELHLKETEFRFNHRHLDLYKTLLKLLRDDPL
ncbi:IS1595 family transposase [Allofranklinella schreckenbergeri]|uniref:IS1595 family transposase n=4 Tax=Comamonadaceae TaxID=80864 RepID=A0A3M6R6S9_9BURK|nr:IS1595 family transposase [Allofranklinella schreckenbergeri]RMX10954.1 IS1595 family transposase [Allofranklinella schreckenbergeri]